MGNRAVRLNVPAEPEVTGVAVYTLDSAGVPTSVSSTSPLPVSAAQGAASAANVLSGFQSSTVSTAATTLITVPAGRSWFGRVGISCSVAVSAAATTTGQARGVMSVAGTGATPTAGNFMAVDAKAGANAATGTVGTSGANAITSEVTVVAPAGNAVTLQITTTLAGTAGVVDSWAHGALVA